MEGVKNINREKAIFAFKSINQEDILKCENFKSDLRQLPMYIYTNGLIATLLFILKKSKNGKEQNSYGKIQGIIEDYIKNSNINSLDFHEKDLNKFVDSLFSRDSKQYRRITLDIISLLDWLIKFADGMIEDKKGETNEAV
ncbi:type III-B CRISPR module-associated protein Cmr5 [Clostridium sp.]|jgi:CRISPR-associated protein Cmr5|uniref:type III-B CRISPR module-associated protein Cmr5 n=1 Tax=Clostridium sp. TaxID=1506 RepID=UPI002FDD5F59